MIGALIWLAQRIAARRAARQTELYLGRAVLAWKRERYELNPLMRTRTRIPKIARPS